MKKRLFLMTLIATILLAGNAMAFSKEFNFYQTNSETSKKQTEKNKLEAKEKRTEAKKEAAEKRHEAKMIAKNNKTKKKHKKFLGIF